MSRLALPALIALCRTAAACDGANIVEVAAEALVSPINPWVGASVHYEHRFADSTLGFTARAGAAAGEVIVDDEGSFVMVDALVRISVPFEL